jgi:DNA polymerase elongation subunit (family B)
MSTAETAFAQRIVSIDYYMAPPQPTLDVMYCKLGRRDVRRVPVMRIFGPTVGGQKACSHIHGVFPYLMIQIPPALSHLSADECCIQAFRACEASLDGLYRSGIKLASQTAIPPEDASQPLHHEQATDSSRQFIHDVSICEGLKPFYGFHWEGSKDATEQNDNENGTENEKYTDDSPSNTTFLKISCYSPWDIPKLATLLLSPTLAPFGTPLQPFEAHFPFHLQFMMDYNLYGMGLIEFDPSFIFRSPIPKVAQLRGGVTLAVAPEEPTPAAGPSFVASSHDHLASPLSHPLSLHLYDALTVDTRQINQRRLRQSSCSLEVDVTVSGIIISTVNEETIPPVDGSPSATTVHSLAIIWEEEAKRRRAEGLSSWMTPLTECERPSLLLGGRRTKGGVGKDTHPVLLPIPLTPLTQTAANPGTAAVDGGAMEIEVEEECWQVLAMLEGGVNLPIGVRRGHLAQKGTAQVRVGNALAAMGGNEAEGDEDEDENDENDENDDEEEADAYEDSSLPVLDDAGIGEEEEEEEEEDRGREARWEGWDGAWEGCLLTDSPPLPGGERAPVSRTVRVAKAAKAANAQKNRLRYPTPPPLGWHPLGTSAWDSLVGIEGGSHSRWHESKHGPDVETTDTTNTTTSTTSTTTIEEEEEHGQEARWQEGQSSEKERESMLPPGKDGWYRVREDPPNPLSPLPSIYPAPHTQSLTTPPWRSPLSTPALSALTSPLSWESDRSGAWYTPLHSPPPPSLLSINHPSIHPLPSLATAPPQAPLWLRGSSSSGAMVSGISGGGVGGPRVPALSFNPSHPPSSHLTVLSLECLLRSSSSSSSTTTTMRPNPAFDPIHALTWAIMDEATGYLTLHRGCIMVHPASSQPGQPLPTSLQCTSLSQSLSHALGPGMDVVIVPSEMALFDFFLRSIVTFYDPDLLVGWEPERGSFGLLIQRGKVLQIPVAAYLSKLNGPAGIAEAEAASLRGGGNGSGNGRDRRSNAAPLSVRGRVALAGWKCCRREVALPHYSQAACVYHILHTRLPVYSSATMQQWLRSPLHCHRALAACDEATVANLRLLRTLNVLPQTAELSRVFGIEFQAVLSRGSQYRVESVMVRAAHGQGYVMLSPSRGQVAGQRALECVPLIMEPRTHFYTSPVLVLDFQSLYPSVMIAYNLCYSTCLGKKAPAHAPTAVPPFGCASLQQSSLSIPASWSEAEDVFETSNGVRFVKAHRRRGILPRLLHEILRTRIMVKQSMKRNRGAKASPALERMLHARQMALKMIANVTYGYTSASYSGRMPHVDIADSIVKTGRDTIEAAIQLIEGHALWQAEVVYSDTDSVFVHLPGRSREEAFEIGEAMAKAVTARNPAPIELKFEKVYHPCVLLAKKRYVGYKWEQRKQTEPIFDAKGIETVRRDTCPLVAKMMEQSLRLLFETANLSKIKAYTLRQFSKMFASRIHIDDFVFAKEVKLGHYAAGIIPPPAAIVASRALARDPMAFPLYGERIPYVVVYGRPGARLCDVVVSIEDFLKPSSALTLNYTYYITKQVLPALERVFSLVGCDVRAWYAEMPRSERSWHRINYTLPHKKRKTIDAYYASQICPVCDTNVVNRGSVLCGACGVFPAGAYASLSTRQAVQQGQLEQLKSGCRSCQNNPEYHIECISVDCPIFYRRRQIAARLLLPQDLSAVLERIAAMDEKTHS